MKFSYVKYYKNGLVIATEPRYKTMDKTSRDEFFNSLAERYGCFEETSANNGNLYRTVRRIRATIRDYVLSNDFVWFCTFTFKEQTTDRDKIVSQINDWCKYIKKKYVNDLKYIILLERHKSGAFHAHALLCDKATPYMKFAQKRSSAKLTAPVDSYNFELWKKGFSTCEYIEDKERVSTYILKYITKDVEITPGRKNYFASRNLDKPIIMKDVVIDDVDFTKIESYEYFLVYKMATTDIVDYL
ncbi:rolling circle replication-associated protein [Erysipelothrix aquatica]|uniref:rolling circle replication-associated protein n=1 Tax=Erysipelothrix aquatica TaxID=2683714 RepID=UPI001356A417|nr:hypothetical protein [Erysipelothrix aquatica]